MSNNKIAKLLFAMQMIISANLLLRDVRNRLTTTKQKTVVGIVATALFVGLYCLLHRLLNDDND